MLKCTNMNYTLAKKRIIAEKLTSLVCSRLRDKKISHFKLFLQKMNVQLLLVLPLFYKTR